MLDKLDAALRFGTEALNLRAQRQEILASNIANADTPERPRAGQRSGAECDLIAPY